MPPTRSSPAWLSRQRRVSAHRGVLFRAADGAVPFDFSGRLSFSWPATAMPVTFRSRRDRYRAHCSRPVRGSIITLLAASRTCRKMLGSSRTPGPRRELAPRGSRDRAMVMFVADQGAEVHVTTERQRSPHEAVGVAAGRRGHRGALERQPARHAVDQRARDDLRPLAGRGGALTLRYRIDSAPEQRRDDGHALRGKPHAAPRRGRRSI